MHPRASIPAIILLLLALALPAGCAAPHSTLTIEAAYADHLAHVQPGITTDEFRRVLPGARLYNVVTVGDSRTEIYRLDHLYKPDELPAKEESRYFFFREGRLVRWGIAPW